jgi:peroxiredoxin
MTGRPDTALPENWDAVPGARGCTPQACAFRDLHEDLVGAGATAVFGVSTQPPEYQAEAAARLHLPYDLLSDAHQELGKRMKLPSFELGGAIYYSRLTLIVQDQLVRKVFYPVFPPDENPTAVLSWLRVNAA